MKYPAFIQEMAAESNRRKLHIGIWSGYIVASAFLILTVVAHWQKLIAWSWVYYCLLLGKYATNTLAWWSLRARKAVLETQGLNTLADVIVLTGAIYLTGAHLSPLFAIYVILIAVVAMLSNRGVTIMTCALSVAAYSAMSFSVHVGILPPQPAPVAYTGGVTGSYVLMDWLIRVGLLAALTYYLATVLRVLREKEIALEHKTQALIDASQHKREFMTNMTHELRTPIHGVLGLTELIESGVYGDLSDKQREALTGIRKSSDGLLHLVDDLLQLARAESGKLEVHRSEFELEELLQRTVSAARWMQGRKQLTIDLEVDDGVPTIDSDQEMIAHVVVNLLSNAIKFTPEGGHIAVRARMLRAGSLEITVEDTGVGIPPEELPHIFDEFRQVDGTSSRRYGGAGVGLSLVKTVTDALGGEVVARSAKTNGSTFTVRLPV